VDRLDDPVADIDPRVDSDAMTVALNKVRLFSLTATFEAMLALALCLASLGGILVVSGNVSLFSNPIVIALMAISGACLGAAIILLWPRLSRLLPGSLPGNRWTPIALLVALQSAGVIAVLLK
jgi:hypothetical protein